MTTPILTFANGDTNYVSKLNANFAAIGPAIDTLISQMGSVTSGTLTQLSALQALFGTQLSTIGAGSYLPTGSGSTLTIAPGYAWLPASLTVVSSSGTSFDFSSVAAGTYYTHISPTGSSTYDTNNANAIYSVVWTGSAFGTIQRIVPEVDIEYQANKGQPDGYAGLDAGGFVPVANLPVMGASGADHAAGIVPDPGATAGAVKFLREDASWDVPAGSGGTVNSVGLSLPSIFEVSDSPVTTSGTLTATLATESANQILAGPASGSAAAPAFRELVAEDLPAMVGDSGSGGTQGAVPAPAAGTAAAGKYLKADGTWSVPSGGGGGGSQPYDIAAFYPGSPIAAAVVLFHVVNRTVTLPAALAGSHGVALTASAGTATFIIKHNGSAVGTVVFTASATATFTLSGGATLSAGDTLEIVAPNTPDSTLANIAITLAGTR
jgi:hypothetical protein